MRKMYELFLKEMRGRVCGGGGGGGGDDDMGGLRGGW